MIGESENDKRILKLFGIEPITPITMLKSQKLKRSIDSDYIKGIFVNEDEKIVVTVFDDGGKEIVKCSEEDEFDVAVGVALGVCRHLFGHTTFYKKIVEGKATCSNKKSKPAKSDYINYLNWCKENKKRKVSETTFRKNKNKYLAKMKGEN